jgi:2',3'-cyclic-nucleotide 2'-phosphodiesterase (5'-nucleotidase family)
VGSGKSHNLRLLMRDENTEVVITPLSTDRVQGDLQLVHHGILDGPASTDMVFRFAVLVRELVQRNVFALGLTSASETCISTRSFKAHVNRLCTSPTTTGMFIDLDVPFLVSALRCLARLGTSVEQSSLTYNIIIGEGLGQRSRRAATFHMLQDPGWVAANAPRLAKWDLWVMPAPGTDSILAASFSPTAGCLQTSPGCDHLVALAMDADVYLAAAAIARTHVITAEDVAKYGPPLAEHCGRTLEQALDLAVATRHMGPKYSEITLLSFNDTHSAMDGPLDPRERLVAGGAECLAGYVDFWRRFNGNSNVSASAVGGSEASASLTGSPNRATLLFNVGDMLIGTPYFDLFPGVTERDLLNHVAVNASAPGNHDLDAFASAFFPNLGHPIVCANVEPACPNVQGRFEKFVVLRAGQHKIAVTGLMDEDAWQSVAMRARGTADGFHFRPPLEVLPALVATMRQAADLVICLSHSIWQYNMKTLAPLGFFDVILGGHSHSHPFTLGGVVIPNSLDNGLGGTFCVQASAMLHSAARVHLAIRDNKIQLVTSAVDTLSGTLWPRTPLPWLAPYREAVHQAANDVVGRISFSTVGGHSKSFAQVAEGYIEASIYRRNGQAQIGMCASGGVCTFSYVAGPISRAQVMERTKHGVEETRSFYLPGAAISVLLEDSVSRLGISRTLQVAGLRYHQAPHPDEVGLAIRTPKGIFWGTRLAVSVKYFAPVVVVADANADANACLLSVLRDITELIPSITFLNAVSPTISDLKVYGPRARKVHLVEVYEDDSQTWSALDEQRLYRVACSRFVFDRTVTPLVGAHVSNMTMEPDTFRATFEADLRREEPLCLPPREMVDVDFAATNIILAIARAEANAVPGVQMQT